MIKLHSTHIIIISMIIFVILNIIENLIHWNIGKNSSNSTFSFQNPSFLDWVKIIFIMILFGFLQGFLTDFFSNYY